MDHPDIVTTLSLMAELLEVHGENPFKIRAYQNAARALKGVPVETIDSLVAEGRLTSIPGIGKGIAETITELVQTGRSDALDSMRQGLPTEFPEMLKVPGLGPKKIKLLHDTLGIDTISELQYAVEENRLIDLPGFGAKTQDKIRQGLSFVMANRGRFLLGDTLPTALELKAALEARAGFRVHIAGDVRRCRAIVEELALVLEDPGQASVARLAETLQRQLGQLELDRVSPTRLRVLPSQGPRVLIELATPATVPAALCLLTGSEAHVQRLHALAAGKKLELRPEGLFKGDAPLELSDEAALYDALGLAWIPPELREDTGEIEVASGGALPALIDTGNLQGVFHVHTKWSDGSATLEDMAGAAAARGLSYVGISDHSKTAGYAHGLDEARLAEQGREIDTYNRDVASQGKGPWLFKGSEVDILPDGRLDLDDEALNGLDFVIASVHSGFNQPGPEVTARILRAIAHPKVTILGHPTGRLLLGREGYAVDLEAVLQAAAKHGTIMEINANPHRLDLSWRWIKRGRELGVRFAVNPDAHSPRGFTDVTYGIGNARRGWLTGQDVINTLSLAEMKQWLQARREARHV